jgi:hypothetical protein
MTNKNCCICLTVRNSEEGLPHVFNNINKIIQSSIFDTIKIIIAYDKSTDNSSRIISDYMKNNNNVELIFNNCNDPIRTVRIATARNNLVSKVFTKYGDYKYFIMMDTNEYSCIGEINIDVLRYSISCDSEWDSISFDREAGYYDIWALSIDPYIFSFFNFPNWREIDLNGKMSKFILNKLHSLKENELLEVHSAFNGCSIYKTDKFKDCTYSGQIKYDVIPYDILFKNIKEVGTQPIDLPHHGDCEHRSFHLEAIKKHNAKIRISPKSLFKKVPNPRPNLRGPA